jgi:hypothetical protein
VAMTPSGVGKVWARNVSSSAGLMLMIRTSQGLPLGVSFVPRRAIERQP